MASVILESGSRSDENEEKSTPRVECKRTVDEISVIDIEKRTEDDFMDSLSEDLPLLDEDFPIVEADNERSSESENERKNIPQPEKFYEFSNQKPRRQERYRQKSDDDNEDNDDDKEDEDNEEPAGTSGHQWPDDDNDDDANLPGTGPSSRGTSNEPPPPPPTSWPDPLASTSTNFEHTHDIGAARGIQDQANALMTYKKHSTAMVSSTGTEMAISTAMVSSIKGKEMAITNDHDSLNTQNPWIYKEFKLAKEVKLNELLKVDDMYGDMERRSLSIHLGSRPSVGTQGSTTQDPHIAASDSSSDFDVMEGYPTQQNLESSSQDMHALDQQPGSSMFSRLKETLSRATRSEQATNEINKGGGKVDLPFTSQIDPVLSKSAHVSTLAITSIGPETLLPHGKSLAEVQEVERYILAIRVRKIESLRKAEQRQAILAKAPMTSASPANPLQSPELTALKSQTIGSHIASSSKDTPNTSILNGVFLNENWEYNLKMETDLYTSYMYHVGWLNVIQATSNSTSVDEQQRMICDVIHSIVQMERQNLGINMPSMGPMGFLDTAKAKQPIISQMETPSGLRGAEESTTGITMTF
ncbi:hypothetical protein L7F22_059623 [Adiantum nelumboides]|nr:hypothetical protein [Adiantum nelumboides]